MKRIIFVTNHIQQADGICSSLIKLVNNIDNKKYQIIVVALYKYDKDVVMKFDKQVTVLKVFGFYFRGLDKIANILKKQLYRYIFTRLSVQKEDIVIGYCHGMPLKIVSLPDNTAFQRIGWIHGIENSSKFYSEYYKFDKVISVSIEGKEWAKKNKVKKVFQLNNIVNIQAEKGYNIAYKFSNNYPTASIVGRLSPEKGLIRLIDVINLLKQESIYINLYIVGDGFLKKDLQKMVNKYSLTEQIKLVGVSKQVEEYLLNSDFYVCASYNEGLSVSTIEAVCVGLPVITTNVAGAKQIVNNGKCGIIVNNDKNSLKEGIKEMISRSDQWKYYSENCIKEREKYLPETVLNNFYKIIDTID